MQQKYIKIINKFRRLISIYSLFYIGSHMLYEQTIYNLKTITIFTLYCPKYLEAANVYNNTAGRIYANE